jgi:hypothetical protein
MLDRLKTLFTPSDTRVAAAPAASPTAANPPNAPVCFDAGAVQSWAQCRGWVMKPVRGAVGFIVEAQLAHQAFRLEWGPAQRDYIPGQELRLRAEMGLPEELQALLMSRSLQEPMEARVFEDFVEDVQTRIDTRTPPEMRWLVMYPRLAASELGALKAEYVAAGSHKAWLVSWLAAEAVQKAMTSALPTSPASHAPLVVTCQRGRLTLRTGLAEPNADALQALTQRYEALLASALAVGVSDSILAPSTLPDSWDSSAAPAMPDAQPPQETSGRPKH